MYLVWKKYQVFSKAAEKFLEVLQHLPELAGNGGDRMIGRRTACFFADFCRKRAY